MRLHVVVADRRVLELIEEALKLVEDITGLLNSFEASLRSGKLESELNRLAGVLEQIFASGVSFVDTALERARLLAGYAHALRVRLSSRFGGPQPYLSREFNDFSRHLGYIKSVLDTLHSAISTALGASRNRVSRGDRFHEHPAE